MAQRRKLGDSDLMVSPITFGGNVFGWTLDEREQIALAWLLHKPAVTSPIASATNDKQLQDLVDAASVKLDPQQMEMLDKASEY